MGVPVVAQMCVKSMGPSLVVVGVGILVRLDLDHKMLSNRSNAVVTSPTMESDNFSNVELEGA